MGSDTGSPATEQGRGERRKGRDAIKEEGKRKKEGRRGKKEKERSTNDNVNRRGFVSSEQYVSPILDKNRMRTTGWKISNRKNTQWGGGKISF